MTLCKTHTNRELPLAPCFQGLAGVVLYGTVKDRNLTPMSSNSASAQRIVFMIGMPQRTFFTTVKSCCIGRLVLLVNLLVCNQRISHQSAAFEILFMHINL